MAKKENIGDNIIVLRSVNKATDIKIYTNPAKDPRTRQYPKCVKRVNSQGDMICSQEEINSGLHFIPENEVIILEDGTTFDLNDPIQKRTWEAVEHCVFIAPSRDARDKDGNYIIDGSKQRYGAAELYIERPGVETTRKVNKKKSIHDAHTYIWSLSAEEKVNLCALLGKLMSNVADADVTDYLLEVAAKQPKKVLDLKDSEDAAIRLLFLKAKDKKVIYIQDGVYKFGDEGIVLGSSDEAVVTFLNNPKNNEYLKLIQSETNPDYFPKK